MDIVEDSFLDELIITNPEIESKKDWNAYKDYTPEKVMKIFDNSFLKDSKEIHNSDTHQKNYNICFFITTYRQTVEIEYSAKFFTMFSDKLISNSDVILHCNGKLSEMVKVAENSPYINNYIIKKTAQFHYIIR